MLTTLVRASIDGAVLVALVWIVTRVLRLSAPVRTFVWWCVAARFVVALIWPSPIGLPILPPEPEGSGRAAVRLTSPVERTLGVPVPPRPSSSPVVSGAIELGSTAVLIWLAGVLLLCGAGLRRWWQTAAVVRDAVAAPEHLQSAAAALARTLRLRRVPQVRVSTRVDTPLVAGLRRPVVLLPAAFDRLDPRQQQMAICHELAHVKRADLWLGCVPALAERIFFFHPLAHVASREYALWREAACDARVIQALGAAPHEYGRLLLNLGVARPKAGLAAAGASWSFVNLKRRIAMLHDVPAGSRVSRILGGAAVVLALAAIIPMQLVARAPERASGQAIGPFAVEYERQTSPAAAPAGQESTPVSARPFDYVLIREDNGSVTTSGSSADVERARKHKRAGEALVWIREGEREYVIRDPELLREIENVWNEAHRPIRAHAQSLEEVLPAHIESAVTHALSAAGEALAHVPTMIEHHKLGAFQEAERALGDVRVGDIVREATEHARHALDDVLDQGFIADIIREASRQAREALDDEHVQDAIREAGRLSLRVDSHEIEEASRKLSEDLRDEMDQLRDEMRSLSHDLRERHRESDEMNDALRESSRQLERAAKRMADHAQKAEREMRAIIERAISSGRADVVR